MSLVDNNLKDKSILIIENDDEKQQALHARLSGAGFKKLIYAKNQAEVFVAIRPFQDKISELGLILLAHELPQCDSLELCKIVTTLDGHDAIPLIFLVNKDKPLTESLVCKCANANAATVIHYPENKGEFTQLVTIALALKSERDSRLANEEHLIRELAERRIMEARLQYLVAHDELTGLSNRSGLEKAINFGIIRCANFKQHGALLDIDLDQFKVINDIEGHEIGDKLLIEISVLIRAEVESGAFVARVGSNLFQVFLTKVSQKKALEIAERIRLTIDEFIFDPNENSYNVSASIGVAILAPLENVSRPSELMSRAHQACYAAKRHGRNRVELFEENNIERITMLDDAKWVPLIRKALSTDAFKLVFQPVVRVSDGRVTHYETLLRMISEEGEMLSPGIFIPVAERMGLIHQIDLWVVNEIIDYIASLPKASEDISFTVNLSSHALQSNYLLPVLRQKLESTWISPSRLTFEITETAAVSSFTKTREMISRIRALGCRFALDDFGAGFSSFNYIKNFPVEYLKIDGQFIENIAKDSADQVLVRAMVDIARSLGKKTIAEYVSNPDILRVLKEIGVDYVQGHLLGKPESELLDTSVLELDGYLTTPINLEKLITA